MVSRRVSAALIAFGITLASVFAAAHDGRKDRDDDENGRDEARIRQGFEIAPVPLHFKKKDHDLVGLGSYIVNAQGGCNDCHTNPPYATGGDPHLGQPKVVNSTHYLAGGMAFGPFVSRNGVTVRHCCSGTHALQSGRSTRRRARSQSRASRDARSRHLRAGSLRR